ncbi:alpha-(1-_3)-arabinofuranosyltransferase domain-containing protein [Nocardioides sp.]|uniref:alpha-(1->3)-arabinofuranosyltransferase domain-containing protein n=1 Tax=Nocardioides sp. TaxID=35761 RepID=UPI002B26E133|nr:alpha-(1->3)-arabinofuranosyltransferase family protein [Nocardioides sp.]
MLETRSPRATSHDRGNDRGNDRGDAARATTLTVTAYLVLGVLILTEKFGQTTSDTRLDLTNAPTQFLRDTFTLWSSRVSLGELQNQAYGYLWPQGPFFSGLIEAGVAPWVTERLWSLLVLVVACEGLRRVALALGLDVWAAALAGLAYGLSPRMVAELGVRSAEILPGAVLPWALLPLVLAITGRLQPWRAAVLSAAAFAFSGGVNGTATFAPSVLLIIVMAWAVLSHRLSWRMGFGWAGLMVAVNAWWALALVQFGAYSPPFFDYVEDARTTTLTAGFSNGLRGTSNWVDYIVVGGRPWWPAGYDVSYDVWVVLASGVVAAVGVLGLMRCHGPFRTPLLIAAAVGITSLCIAHTGLLPSPLSQPLQDLLDGPLAPLRNVPKADPILRVPISLGVAVLLGQLIALLRERRPGGPSLSHWRRATAGIVVGALALAVATLAAPIADTNLRTPGWEEIPDYWQEASAYLDETQGSGAAWIVPGSAFGIQTWGWTMEEPLQVLGTSPWVTRSQVPLVPAATIRMLSSLELYLTTGAGSPYLAQMLRRVGIDRIVLRHDLDQEVSQATPANLVRVALGRSPGIKQVETFGQLSFGPAIEVFALTDERGEGVEGVEGYQLRDVDDSVTVASSVEDAVTAVGAGLVGDDQAMLVQGDESWQAPADLQGDGFRRRERAFGRVHQAVTNVMTAEDAYRGGRVLPNYPGPPGAAPVVASYDGLLAVTASTSAGYADIIGEVRPENAPWAAFDGDSSTFWKTAPFVDPNEEWIDVDLGRERVLDEVVLQQATAPLGLQSVETWSLSLGGTTVTATSDPFSGRAVADLDGATGRHLRIEVASTPNRSDPVGLAEVSIDGLTVDRTLEVPQVDLSATPDLLFTAFPERRACISTLLGPDCDLQRQRAPEESTGIDRTFTVAADGRWDVSGLVVARSNEATAELVRPQAGPQVRGSSSFGQDPQVSPRMAYDGDSTTSWIADPRDREPTLRIDLGRQRTLRSLRVEVPAQIARVPTRAVIEAGTETREVALDGEAAFEPLRARRLSITFSRPDDGFYALGASEVELSGARLTRPLDGSSPTGSVCGFGPDLIVDGTTVPTRVTGQIGAVVAAGQLGVQPCGGPRRLALDAGEHRIELRATAQFQPVALTLDSVTEPRPVERSRTLEVLEEGETERVVRVGAGEAAILSLPQSFNAGWIARLDGVVLEPLQVDGWSQGWAVPATAAGDVVLTYEPQRTYRILLVGGLVVLALILLAGLVTAVTTRLGPARAHLIGAAASSPPAAASGGRHRQRRRQLAGRAAVGLGLGLVAYAVGGPVVALGAVVGTALASRPRWAQTAAATILLGAVIALVLQVQREKQFPLDSIDLATGFGLALALAAAASASRAGGSRGT